MKKYYLTALLSLSLAACHHGPKDSAEKADSTNMTKDSADNTHPASFGQEISGSDAKFAVQAAAGGMMEIELGKLAQQKGKDTAVKDFAAMMVKDHSASNVELAELAREQHIVLPEKPDEKTSQMKTELGGKNGADFDKAYINAMVKDHEEDIDQFDHGIKVIKNDEMRGFAKKTLPILKTHLATAKKIQSKIN